MVRSPYPSRPFATIVVTLDPGERTRDGEASRQHEDALYGISRELDLSAVKRRNSWLQRIHLGEISRDIVVAAALAVGQNEAVAREHFGRAGAAKMDYGGKS